MAKQTTLRQANNNVVIEGILQEVAIKEYQKDGKKSLSGKVLIQQDENSVHEIRVYANEKTKNGDDNKIYKGLETVMTEYKSISQVGLELADKVRVTQAELKKNDYLAPDGKMRSYPKFEANFINRLKEGEPLEPRAEFDVELFITLVKPEMDREGEETGRFIVEGVIPLYNGILSPQTFIAEGEGAEFVESNFEKGQTVQLYGNIINSVEVIKKEVAATFGKPKTTITTNTTREFLITGGTEPYDEDSPKAYSPESIKSALVERETYLNSLKEKKNDKPKKSTTGGGFGTARKENTKPKVDISDDDLPF